MIKKVKIIASFLVLSGLVVANKALAVSCNLPLGCQGTVNSPCTAGASGCTPVPASTITTELPKSGFENYISSALSFAIWTAGLLSVAFIIIGGIQYITAGASKDGAQKAKTTLTYAIIGLVIVLLAFVIRNFVLGRLGVTEPAL